jgi:hypothetical protein
MVRDKSHLEQIERWGDYVKNNNWKKEHTKFIDAQILIARRVYEKLSKTPEGREKIRLLKKLK